jgi:hypothetical protein
MFVDRRRIVLNVDSRAAVLSLTVVCLLLAAPGTLAQRAAARAATSEYNLNSTLQIHGVLARFAARQEIELTLLVPLPDDDDAMEEWTVFFGDTEVSELYQAGIQLSPGSELTVAGNPHRNRGRHRILANTVRTPDGSSWSR